MWKTFACNSDLFMLKLKDDSEDIELYLTDFMELWHSVIPSALLLQIFSQCNKSIEAKYGSIKSTLMTFLNELENCIVVVKRLDQTELELSIDSLSEALTKHLSSKKISFKFNLSKMPQEEFKKHITVPFIQTVHFLEESQKSMTILLQKKDRELQEYRLEKGSISRDDLTTENFDANLLENKNEKLLLKVFGESKKFWDAFATQNGEVETSNHSLNVKVDPWNFAPKKRKVYNSKTVAKKSGITYKK